MRFPNWGGHALLGRIAFEALPAWERELIKPDMTPEALTRPYIPDYVKSVGDKVGFMCAILDLVYYDECRPFATLPDGRWIPHSPPDADGQSSVGSGGVRSLEMSTAITELLFERMIGAIRAGDWERAIRHGGALAHYLQEPFTPGHAVDNRIFHELFPDPDEGRHVRLHGLFDSASDGFDPAPPVLMGLSVPEAAFRIQVEIDRGIREGKKLIAPVIRSYYDGEGDEARKRLLAPQCRHASFVTASAWHTAICIALERFEPNETERLETLDLTELVPYFIHHCRYVDLLPGWLVREGRKIPIHVWTRTPDGRKREEKVESGFGMGGHSGVKFYVNGDVYRRFRCRVGLPSRHLEGQTENTNTVFYVETDTAVNTRYSEEIEYGARTLAQTQLAPGEPVVELDVDISGARSLILRAQSKKFIDAASGKVGWSIPHVAVCDPVLSKS